MQTMLVGYDLKKPGKDYSKLIDQLKSYKTWWHCLDSTWMIRTSLTHVALRDELRTFIDPNDKLLVIDVTGDAAAWTTTFSEECAKWIKDNL